jgi:hypothetical protein
MLLSLEKKALTSTCSALCGLAATGFESTLLIRPVVVLAENQALGEIKGVIPLWTLRLAFLFAVPAPHQTILKRPEPLPRAAASSTMAITVRRQARHREANTLQRRETIACQSFRWNG